MLQPNPVHSWVCRRLHEPTHQPHPAIHANSSSLGALTCSSSSCCVAKLAFNAGLGFYVKSAAGSLVWDALSVSKSLANATMTTVRRLYSKPSNSSINRSSSTTEGKAFSSGDTALTDADGFVAEADRFLITGKEEKTTHPEVMDDGTPPEPLQLADMVVVSGQALPEAQAESALAESTLAESTLAESHAAEATDEVVRLGKAAIAVNEAEDSLIGIAEELEAGTSKEGLRGVVQDAKGGLTVHACHWYAG